MAYLGVDAWRLQYFEPVVCPAGLDIPVDEASAWQLFPELRHVHNKLWICRTQDLAHAPHGVAPPSYPVFSKPIYNLRGMGSGGCVLRSAHAYRARLTPGHMWMTLLRGPHVSSDVALVRGRARWWRHTTGRPAGHGTFDYWTVHAEAKPELEAYLFAWLARCLPKFTGIVNFETIAGRIIECHLRMAEQWLDLNGKGWLQAVVDLYQRGVWRFADPDRRTGYSVVLFAPHGRRWRPPAPERIEAVRRMPEISSVQITFDPRRPPEQHAMPPGGFRLAIINCRDLAAGRRARRDLRAAFGVD